VKNELKRPFICWGPALLSADVETDEF